MMFYPFSFGMPYYNRYSRYGYSYPGYSYGYKKNGHLDNHCFENKKTKKEDASRLNQKYPPKKDTKTDACEETPLFQLFGIQLYFDDILLICLIWFLWEEDVKDEGLFMALILLLIS